LDDLFRRNDLIVWITETLTSRLHRAVATAPAATVQRYHFPDVSGKALQLS
jgi:hypothetical protein